MIKFYFKLAGSVIFIVFIVAFAVIFGYLVEPTKRGFFCGDESINYPFREDTVKQWVVLVACVPPALIFLALGEMYVLLMKSTNNTLNKKKYGIALARCFVMYLWGIGILFALLNTAKITIGRLRPHFLAVCMPNVDIRNCLPNTFITEYVCTNPDTKKVKDSRVSFPSNHSAFSFYTAVFIAYYIEHRFRFFNKVQLLPNFIQFVVIALATCCALSRITDNMHHPTDVLAGTIAGSLLGLYFSHKTISYHWKCPIIIAKVQDREYPLPITNHNYYNRNDRLHI